MTVVSNILNLIPGIAEKRYLELGHEAGATFELVASAYKQSVDISDEKGTPTHLMSTDDFFANVAQNQQWDVILIDAGHDVENVVADYNNALKHLTTWGYLLIHDLWPFDERHTRRDAPGPWCGDGFRFLWDLERFGVETYTFDQSVGMGLTWIPSPRPMGLSDEAESLTWDRFYTEFVEPQLMPHWSDKELEKMFKLHERKRMRLFEDMNAKLPDNVYSDQFDSEHCTKVD